MDKVIMLCLVGGASYYCKGIKFLKGTPVPVEDNLAEYLLGISDGTMFEETGDKVNEEKDENIMYEKKVKPAKPKKKPAPKRKNTPSKKTSPRNIHVKKKSSPDIGTPVGDVIEV